MAKFTRPKGMPHRYWHGLDCRKYFTVTTGTCMHATKTPLQNWIYAIYSVMTARKGVSAMQMAKELGISYKASWYMLHRIREGCRSGEFKLSNIVESDTTYIGGKEKNKHSVKKSRAGRGTVGKVPVVGLKQRDGKVKAKPIQYEDAKTLIDFVSSNIEAGTIVYTDDATAYARLAEIVEIIKHETVKHSKGEFARGEIHTNSIESVWAVLKRSLNGTWHHVHPKHLARYLNEITFRLNDGNCEIDTIDRMCQLVKQIGEKKMTYEELTS